MALAVALQTESETGNTAMALAQRKWPSLRVSLMLCEDVMAEGKWVSYLRVSTGRQGQSGLGIEAQRKAVEDFLNGGSWELAKEYVEIESGKKTDRPVLAEALKACRLYGAKLVIAKIDRLSRDAHFLLGLEKAAWILWRLTCQPLIGSPWGSWRWLPTKSGG
jgi:hypothetical protein